MAGQTTLDVPVTYGGVSVGDKTCRIGVTIDPSRIKLKKAEQYFNGRRLNVIIRAGGQDETPGQGHLNGFEEEIEGSADVKGFSVSPNHISAGLTFAIAEMDLGKFSKYAKKSGRLIIEDVEDLPDGDDEDDSEHASSNGHVAESPRRNRAARKAAAEDETWKATLVEDLDLPKSLTAKLHAANLHTIGELQQWTAADGGRHQITDIDGIGPAAAEKIEEALTEFWRTRSAVMNLVDRTAENTKAN